MNPMPLRIEAQQRFASTIAALAQPGDLRALSLAALHAVMALRLAALCERAGRERLAELSIRLGSVGAALALCSLIDAVVRVWPEPYRCSPPCCRALTPDERTVAACMGAAAQGDEAGFRAQIDGLVRPDRHGDFYARAVHAAALVAAI